MFQKCSVATRWGVLSLLAAPAASGAIVNGLDGTQNTTPPPNLRYWSNVGTLPAGADTGGAGVYLGDGWVLTAAHAHGGRPHAFPFVLPTLNNGQDATFYSQPGNFVQLHVEPGTPPSDAMLFRLQDHPLLHTLPTVQFGATPQVGTNITIVGSSWNRAPQLRHWRVADPAHPDESTWTDVTGQLNQHTANRHGYAYDLSGYAKRWGTNTTAAMPGGGPTLLSNPEDGNGNVVSSTMLFAAIFNDLPNEAQVANGDSGGGVFAGNRLVGINVNKGDDSKDPDNPADVGQPEHTAVFGNASLFVNLATYVDQIASVTGLHPSIDGDANLDGLVNGADFALLIANYGAGTRWTQGDFNLNGQVEFGDYQILEANFRKSDPAGASALSALAFATVPEPSGLMLAGVGAFAALLRRHRRHP